MGTTRPRPLPYQKEDVRRITDDFGGRALLAHQMGLGKTPIALWWMWRTKSWPAVVVCPAGLKWNWAAEAYKFCGVRAQVLDGQTPSDDKPGLVEPPLYIINYEILQYWLPWLLRKNLVTSVFDEAHYISNRDAIRSKASRQLSKRTRNCLMLTGTPLTNRPAELWHILHCLKPHLYRGFRPFGNRYCRPRRKPWGMEYKGASRVDELHRKLVNEVMIRRLKSDVLDDLPDKRRQVLPLTLSQDDAADYAAASHDFINWVANKQGVFTAETAARAEAITKMTALKQLAARYKMKATVEWANDWFAQQEPHEKLVMFGWHRKALDVFSRRICMEHTRIDGGTPKKKRQVAVERFQRDPNCRLIIGNRAMCEGVTLTAASTLAFGELFWTPGLHAQAEDRIHRIGQKNAAMVYYLVARNTLEEQLAEIIQDKQEVLSSVLDGGAQAEDIDIFSMLTTALTQAA